MVLESSNFVLEREVSPYRPAMQASSQVEYGCYSECQVRWVRLKSSRSTENTPQVRGLMVQMSNRENKFEV